MMAIAAAAFRTTALMFSSELLRRKFGKDPARADHLIGADEVEDQRAVLGRPAIGVQSIAVQTGGALVRIQVNIVEPLSTAVGHAIRGQAMAGRGERQDGW